MTKKNLMCLVSGFLLLTLFGSILFAHAAAFGNFDFVSILGVIAGAALMTIGAYKPIE